MTRRMTLTHWGAFEVETDGAQITAVHPFSKDPDPSPIGGSLMAINRSRVAAPAIRQSWWEHGPGAYPELRGREPFVEVDWNTALDLAAGEIERVRAAYGNEAIFAGSYGWASAGRFHHAQSQLRRFLNLVGGYTSSRDTYSHAAGEVITPHVLGYDYATVQSAHTSLPVIARHTDLVVSFGGIPTKNAQIQNGGMGRHTLRGWLERARTRGTRFVNISPIRDDMLATLDAEWLAPRPGTDVAVMLGMIHTLVENGRADRAFLQRYCEGWERVESYVMGTTDGVVRSAAWAANICGLDASRIRSLALELVAGRSMLNTAWALQRADHGEHTWWGLITLAAAVGQIGLPGGGFGLGYGAVGSIGNGAARRRFPALPRSPNPVAAFIPVARIADMLLHPGEPFTYDGATYTYPHIELVYWVGGNPFHHHQDLNRLVRAWRRPATVIVNEPFWTATARRADMVLPSTTPLERTDIGGSPSEDFLFSMDQVIVPYAAARDDYEIFRGLAARLGVEEPFTEGRTSAEWLRHLYEEFRARYPDVPAYEDFRSAGYLEHPPHPEDQRVLLGEFRQDPERHPLPTPSGRIELFSSTIAGFDYPDCPPHASFLEPKEWLGNAWEFPLHLVSNQPSTRLHSQLDHGQVSVERKLHGRERLRMHPADAAARGLVDGATVRVFNGRGACFASLELTDAIRPGVVELPTGAWFDPVSVDEPSPCRHGNPNVLTRDAGTSSLAQGPVAQSCLVEVEAAPDAPEPDPFRTPLLITRR